jgi:hypothetical protein
MTGAMVVQPQRQHTSLAVRGKSWLRTVATRKLSTCALASRSLSQAYYCMMLYENFTTAANLQPRNGYILQI